MPGPHIPEVLVGEGTRPALRMARVVENIRQPAVKGCTLPTIYGKKK